MPLKALNTNIYSILSALTLDFHTLLFSILRQCFFLALIKKLVKISGCVIQIQCMAKLTHPRQKIQGMRSNYLNFIVVGFFQNAFSWVKKIGKTVHCACKELSTVQDVVFFSEKEAFYNQVWPVRNVQLLLLI